MPPRLSFVVPYWRKEKSIRKCLKSLFESSFKDIEVIVVFDGEDPSGERIVRKFKKAIIVKKEHGGAPAARNYGATFATGEFISFWDADCYIESGAAEVWIKIFDKFPDIDFCYSGYKFYPEGLGAINGESFDPWLLQVNNYISSMFPIRRSKAPKWDESLKSLQDWDFWLTAVENGCKGFYNRGYGFKTDFPDRESISGKGCAPENWLDRLETVKKKHNIPLREICVSSIHDKAYGIMLAKMIDADYRDYPTYFHNRYKTILQIGFHPRYSDVHAENFRNKWCKSKKILFWRSEDVYALKSEASVESVEALAVSINASLDRQFCEDFLTQMKLRKMGFKVELLSLPFNFKDDEIKPMPEFKIIMDNSTDYKYFFDSIVRSMPDVKFEYIKDVKEACQYSVLVKFKPDRYLDNNVKKMLLNGRYVVSNIPAPYCGFVETDRNDMEKSRSDVISYLRSLQDVKEINQPAINWYRRQYSPETFMESFLGIK